MATDWIADNIIEIFGAVTGIAYVILEIRRNIFLWPLGIVTSAVYIYVFGRNGFYANMGLQWYYLFISIYGWYKWHGAWSKEHGARSKGHGAGSEENDVARSASGKAAKIEEQVIARSASDIVAGTEELVVARSASSIVEKSTSPLSSPSENAVNNSNAGTKETETDIRRINLITAIGSSVTALLIWAGLWFVLDRWTDSPVPLWDGLIASLSVVATWMLTRKILEQWYVWIVANTIAVIVYLRVGLYPTAVLFIVYTVMAVVGLRAWSSELRAQSKE